MIILMIVIINYSLHISRGEGFCYIPGHSFKMYTNIYIYIYIYVITTRSIYPEAKDAEIAKNRAKAKHKACSP